jgi:hypothetical protein
MEGTLDYVIEVICDDPRHARGKKTDIATFGRFTLPNGEVRWLVRDGKDWRYTPVPRATGRGRVNVHRRYDAEPEKGSTYEWPCNLCPRSLEVREGTLDELLETVYQGLLKTGAPNEPITIQTLRRIASTLTRN